MNLPPSGRLHQDRLLSDEDTAVPRRKFSLGKWLVLAAALVLLGAALGYLSEADNRTASIPLSARGGGPPAAPVRVSQIVRRDLQVIRRTPGTVVANTTVQVTARVQGIIESARFKEGQFVKKGDLLFQIDPKPFEAALDQAKAVLLRDQAALKNANRDLALYENLNRIGAVSTQQRDTALSNVEVLTATLVADQAAINLAQLNLGYTQIRSPVNGKTGPILIQPGNMVLATGTTPLVTIQEIQPVKISFNLPQADLQLILERQKTKGLTATVDAKDANGEPLSAPVDFTSNAVNNQSGTLELRATFDNKDFSFLPGELVNVIVELDTLSNVLVVPHDAVNDGPDGSFVYVVGDGRARQHNVNVLFDDAKNVAIDGDVKAGDQVIVEGQLRVQPDAPISISNAPAEPNKPADIGLGAGPR
jgi:multidrug efflux system membrane fusion protein